MGTHTHGVTFNAGTEVTLTEDVFPYRDQIDHSLVHLDGGNEWSYSLRRAFVDADAPDKRVSDEQYMQSAGNSEEMTIEVRFSEDVDGGEREIARHYVVGRPGSENTGESPLTLKFDNSAVKIQLFPNEVFDADEAVTIFYEYFLTDQVPAPYVLRLADY